MNKKITISLILVLVLLLVSCVPQAEEQEDVQEGEVNNSEELQEESVELPEGECEPRWGCISSSVKAYQTEDCSWVDRKDCPLGCSDGECRAGNTCNPGFKCKDENTRGYQTEVCHWTKEKECEWGCSDGECSPQPENYTEPVEEEVEEEPEEETIPQKNVKLINAGETHSIEDQELSVYLIEEGRTKLQLGEQKSDWLMGGGNHTFSSGIKITVESILFQSYEGGTKAVEYTVG